MNAEEYPNFPYDEAAKWAKDAGVSLWSFHLPFCPFEERNPASSDAAVRASTVGDFTRYLEISARIGAKVAVIHASGEPIADEDRKAAMAHAKEVLSVLAERAAATGVTLCVEDLPRTCLGRNSAELLDLLSADARLGVCFDTNHLLGEPIADFIRAVGNRIVTTHFSDYDFVNERHWLPGAGKIDWRELMDLLDEVGYTGPVLYELGFSPNPKSADFARPLVPEDFARNARELDARLPLTTPMKGKENLPMWV